eukprot:scaffold23697_cov59-Phaeocystis_antarctica.AAC.2
MRGQGGHTRPPLCLRRNTPPARGDRSQADGASWGASGRSTLTQSVIGTSSDRRVRPESESRDRARDRVGVSGGRRLP